MVAIGTMAIADRRLVAADGNKQYRCRSRSNGAGIASSSVMLNFSGWAASLPRMLSAAVKFKLIPPAFKLIVHASAACAWNCATTVPRAAGGVTPVRRGQGTCTESSAMPTRHSMAMNWEDTRARRPCTTSAGDKLHGNVSFDRSMSAAGILPRPVVDRNRLCTTLAMRPRLRSAPRPSSFAATPAHSQIDCDPHALIQRTLLPL